MTKHFRLNWFILSVLLFMGCDIGGPKQRYVSISEGLSATQQWKCNPAFGDVNGDGLLDLAAVSRKGEGARVFINRINRGGNTWSQVSEGLAQPFSCGGGVDFGDVNGDGHLDLAVGDHCQGLFVYAGDGTGKKWTLGSDSLPKMQADDVALADFNGDGQLDLVVCSANEKGVRLFLGNGKGGWEKAHPSGLPTSDDCTELAVGDFNHDGRLDLAATMVERPQVWLNIDPGKWTESSSGLPDTSGEGGQYWGIAAGDVNHDGHLDLALGRMSKGPEVYLGDGTGHWRPALSGLSEVPLAMGVVLGDMDRDGHLDLVVSGKKDLNDMGKTYGIFLFRGDGQGRWKFLADSGLPQQDLHRGWGLALADLEGDGDLEIGGCFGSEGVSTGGSLEVWKLKRIQ